MSCKYTINGKEYSLAEFKAYLVDGGLDSLYPNNKYPWAKGKESKKEVKSNFGFDASLRFADLLLAGQSFDTIVQARKALTDQNIVAGTIEAKQADEAIELAGVLAGKQIINKGLSESQTFDALVKLADQMPSLNVRTSTSIEQQAYSTPLPLAYLASELAGITEKTTVTESTAGNGALLIAANPELATVNELNPDRARSLKEQGFNVTTENAVTHSFTKNGLSDVVIINPPFGTVKDDSGNTITYSIKPMYSTNEVDHAIVMNTLKGMDDDGKAVLIIGGPAGHLSQEGRSDAYNGKAKRTFFYNLYNDYNVVDHFTVSGKLYAKQGAAWPVDVIVIQGKDKSKLRLPAADVPRVINTIEELKNELPDNRPSVSKAEITIDKAQSNSTETGDAGSNLGIRQFSNRRRSENRKRVGVLFRPERSIEANGQIIESNVDESNNNTSNRPVRLTNKPNTVENKFQADYTPASIVNPVGTLVPVNMQSSIEKALQRIIDTHGDIDGYVANLLNYKKEEIGKYFSAEQVDAIALALDNIISGKGFIIGDQTGVGKGRVNAAMIRYAILNKMTPIFVTEKPNLYGDMLRDLSDIGMPDVKPFATNSGENIPIDNEANAWYEESLKAKENGEKIPEKRGKFISMPSGKKQEQNMNSMIDSGKLSEGDVIFTTYNQMQTVKGEITTRTKFLRKLADGCLLILDESHNAGGTSAGPKRGKSAPEEGEKTGRAAIARELVSLAKGVFYSSATYAKRPDVLDLYSKTDMGLVADTASLQQAMVAGGVPLQQAVASMLAESGQYIRREKSFDGIVYGTSFVDVDRNFAEKVAEIMRDIMIFDDLKSVAVSTLKDEAKASASQISVDNAIGKAGIDSQNFTSIMHNMIGQMLLMLKVQPTIDEALEVLKRGEKPVIALSNTMGSVIKEYADEVGLNVGDVINLNCGDLLSRYLERSRRITETDVMGNKVKRSLDDDELGKAASSFYKKIQSKINNFDFSSYKMSPIDAIHNALAKEGYKSGEITGRMNIIDYSGDVPIYKIRPAQELSTAGKRKTVNDFNNGKLDVIILNQSGATGLSLHASPKVGGDTRKRHMIIAQPELNIDTHMQMLGRINRTGQVHLPSYSQLTANIPAEKRPSAILAKKMAMLNANTTAGKESAVKAKDVPDFMNDYGNEIAALVMTDNPEIHKMLGKPLAQGNNGLDKENAMAKVTGRIPVLKLKDQEMLYQMIEDEYNDYIEILTKTGQNQLEAHAMDLDAKIVHTENIVEELGGSTSPFAAGVEAEIVDVKRLGKPYTIEQINSLLEKTEFKNEASSHKAKTDFIAKINEEYDLALAEIEKLEETDAAEVKRKQALKDNIEHQRNNLLQMFSNFYPSKPIVLTSPHGLEYEGIVGKFEKKGQSKNFFAQGQWKVTVYVADATRQVTLPLSKLSWSKDNEANWQVSRGNLDSIKTALAEGQSTSREHRVILTGNMLAAYNFDSTGQIINYTKDNGDIVQGVLMPKKFDLKQAIDKQPVIFSSPDIAMDYINNSNATNKSLRSSNNDFRLMIIGSGATLYAPSAKAKGSVVFNSKRVTDITGPFITRGKEMQARVSNNEIESLLRVLYPIIGSMQPVHKEEGKKFLESKGIKSSKASKPTANGHTKTSLIQAIKSVMGDSWVNRLFATDKFKIISRDEAAKIIGYDALFHKAWHGTPHKVDKFSSKKIGTGEGAQAFGYGLYFTDKKEIAQWYRDKLTNDMGVSAKIGLFGSRKAINYLSFNSPQVGQLFHENKDINFLLSKAKEGLSYYEAEHEADNKYRKENNYPKRAFTSPIENIIANFKKDVALLEKVKSAGGFNIKGNVYEVELAPTQDEYLDWDKPFNEQSDLVQKAIKSLFPSTFFGKETESSIGRDLYEWVGQRAAADKFGEDDKGTSGLLHSVGVRGIRYKAEGGKSDANNYVIFDENDISIEAKYSKDGNVLAFYNLNNDTTYFVHDNINKNIDKSKLKGLIAHEIAVHALHLGKTKAQFNSILEQFEKLKNTNPKIKEAFARVPKGTNPKHVTEEALAYFIENNFESTLAQRFIEFFRQLLRKITTNIAWANKLTEQELRNMATDALRSAPDALMFNNIGRENETIAMSKSNFLAPNGKPSNLNAVQYVQVRTPEFKDWFGDWENDPKNASKVVDENGEPKVVYHKTNKEFTENERVVAFDPDKSVDGWEIHFGTQEASNKLFLPGGEGNQYTMPVFLNIRDMPHTTHDDGHWGVEQLKQLWEKYWVGLPIESKKAVRDKQVADGIKDWGMSYGKHLYYKAIDKANAGERINTSKFMANEMFKYGLTGVSYSNAFEDKGSTSYIVMNPNQIKSAIGNTGEFSKNNPDIRYSKQSPTEIANSIKDFLEPRQGKQELGWLSGFFQRNHLIDFVSKDLPQINNYKLLAQEKDNFINKNENKIAKQYEKFKNKMDAKVMHELGRVQGLATRLNSFDPAIAKSSDPMTFDEREVFEAYSALPAKAKEVYAEMRDDYRADLIEKRNALIDRIKQFKGNDRSTAAIIKRIENHFDKFIKRGVYFPLNRDGNIVITAIDADGEKVVQFVESNKERDSLIKAMKDQGYTEIKTSLKQEINRNVLIGNAANEIVGIADRTVNDLREAVEAGAFDEKILNMMFDDFNQLLLSTLPDTSYRKHFIHRKGTLGESTDALRAYAKTRNSATKNIASLLYDSKIRNVLQQARQDAKNLDLDNTQAIDSVLNELEKREEALSNTQINVASQFLTSLGFIGALGFNIGSAAVNMMQVAGVTLPELSGKYSTKEAYSEITKAYKLIFNPAVLNKKSGFDLMSHPDINQNTKKALEKLSEIGKIDLTMTHDAISAGQNPSYSENIINRSIGNFAKYSGYLFHVAEALNRQVTGIAAFNLAYAKNGGDFDAAIEDAVDVIDRTQFDYGVGNRARYMMGNTARVLTLFKAYALGVSYYIGRNVHNSIKGESPEIRLQARKTLAVQMAMTFATSGVFGLPIGLEAFMAVGGVAGFKYKGANFSVAGAIGGALIFQALLAGLGADDDDDLETEFRNWLADNFNQTTAEWVTKGPARLLPIGDISGRTGQRHLWWQPQNKMLEGTDQYNAFASAFMGPLGSQISNMFTAKKMYEDGQYSRMVESMAPTAIRNIIAAHRLATEGVTTLKGEKIVEKDLSFGDVINKVIGFTPNVIANAYDANSAISKERDRYKFEHDHLVNRYINADKQGRAELMSGEIKDFNKNVTPAERITMKSLLKTMKARKSAHKRTKNGLYLSKKQEHLREFGRFAEYE